MEKINSSELLPPPLTFRIGFVGHRPNRLAGSDQLVLSKALALILANAKEEVSRIWQADSKWYSGDAPVLQAVSSLAEGTDRMFAEEAKKLGYSLSCPMPFPQQEFEADFATGKALEPDSLIRFRKILDQAERAWGLTRFELIGDRNQESQSYRAGGKMVLNQSDLLVVVWDGISQMAVGGTEDMLREALQMHIPVVWIDAGSPHVWMVLDEAHRLPAPGTEGRHVPDDHEDSAALAEIITRSLALPGSGGSIKKEEKPAWQRLSDFYAERSHRWNPAFLWKIFCILLGKGKLGSIFLLFKPDEQAGATPPIQGFENKDPGISLVVRSGFAHCDRLSGYYGDFYRSGYILTFLLAALAVGLALFPVLAGWLTHENKAGESIMVAIELITLLGILLLVFRSRSKRWHSRWLDYRLAAEWIRQLKLLAPLGMVIRVHETRGHQKTYEHPSATWMAWFIKALERNLGLPNARIDAVYLKKYLADLLVLTQDQQTWHSTNSQSNHLIEKRLHRSGILLVGATIAACMIHLLPLFIPELHWPEGFAYLLTFLCGFLPALGAALAGINNQGEFKTLAKTSESMQHEYAALSAELSGLQIALQSSEEKSVNHLFKRIKVAAYRISHLMIEELSDWRITYHNRPLDLPV
jgi:hypothetical protein